MNNIETLKTSNPSEVASVNPPIRWTQKIPGFLRAFGAVAVLFSLYSFMLNGWQGSSDLIRYLMLLGHTTFLAVIALASGHYFKEGKGPRLLLMLALTSVTANFTILGAFIYSGLENPALHVYPQYFFWSVGSLQTALMLTLAASIILLPVVLLGFRTLARGMSVKLSTLFVVGNLALLLPLRDPLWVATAAVLLSIYTVFISAKTVRQRTEIKTFEGKIAMLLQFLPFGILIGRTTWLYAADMFVLVAASITVFIALRQNLLLIKESTRLRTTGEILSMLSALFTGLFLAIGLIEMNMTGTHALVVGGALSSAMIYELSMRVGNEQSLYRPISVSILVACLLFNLFVNGGLTTSLFTLTAGIALLIASMSLQQRSVLIGACMLIAVSVIDQLIHAFQYFDFGYWAAMAVVGIIAIVLGSLLETKGKRIKQATAKYKLHYSEWSY